MEQLETNNLIQKILIYRTLIGFLGEKSQYNWWDTSFLSRTSLTGVPSQRKELEQLQDFLHELTEFKNELLRVALQTQSQRWRAYYGSATS